MAYNESLLTVAAFLSGGLSGLTALIAVSRSRGGARVAGDTLAGVALAAALWAVTFGLRLSAEGVGTASFWLRVSNVVAAPIPTLLLVFSLYQTGNASLVDERVAALLAVEPTAAAALALTNPLHQAYVMGVTTVGVPAATPGVFMSAHLAYGLLVCGVAAVSFGNEAVGTTGPYRRRATLLLTAVSVPVVTVVAYVTTLPIAPPYDTTPVWFGLSSLLFLVSIRSYGLFDVSPVAHETVFEEIDDAIVVVDDRGLLVDANPAATTAFGVDDDDVGRPVRAVLPNPEAIDSLLVDGETTFTAEGRHFEATRTSISVGQAGASNVFVFRDVTDRERVERRFQTYIEQSNDVLVVLDAETTVEYASPATRRVLGHDPETLTGRSVFSLVHPDDQSSIHRVFRSVTNAHERHEASDGGVTDGGVEAESATDERIGGVPGDDERTTSRETTERERFRLKHGDGGWQTVEAVVTAGVGATADRLLVNIRDVTERQRYEQRLRVLNRVLRHDLRNDANVVLGYADLLLKSDLDPAVRERAEAVRRKANRLVELGEQAREVDRTLHAEGGETHRIQLDDVVDSVAWRARETYPEAQVDTECEGECAALGNDLVDSALWHLVSNGIEHNDSAEPWVRVSVESTDDWVRVTVTDDGPGIPESERNVLEHGTETALEHGSGLGLWLVKWITDSVGGDVSFAERDPRGSIVTVELATPVGDPGETQAE
ncbi:histidine kinase N-terminal 7TM domain-containing protein [Halobaculum sp. MBLA0143]|uniref:histidine kinase N-terminal 7TM domain-containing protein n=1 Tax=Halobaculum sp. MBLA0143 TaxID=3079933 RepID=UPI003523981E